MRSVMFFFIALLAIISCTQAQVIPGCSFLNFDFSPIGAQDLYYYGSWTYVLRMCGSISDNICLQDTTSINSMVCQRTNSSADNAWNIVTFDPDLGYWGALNGDITYQLSSGEPCNPTNPNYRAATIVFHCNAAATSPYISSVTEPSTCQYQVVVETNIGCTTQVSCGFLGVDISSAFTSDLFFNGSVTGVNTFAWYLNLCNPVTQSQCAADSTANDAYLCQVRADGSDAFGVANYGPGSIQWDVVPYGASRGLQASLTNGEYCAAAGANRITHVQLVCDPTATTAHLQAVVETSTCVYEATVYTSLTCSILPSSTASNPSATSSSWFPADAPCVFTTRNTGKVFDFSSFKNAEDMVYASYIGSTFYYTYMHLCGMVRAPQCLNDSTTYNAMICQSSATNVRDNYAMATFIPLDMEWVETSTGVQYVQRTGEFCGSVRRQVVVQFVCVPSYTVPQIINIAEPYTCQYLIEVHTSLVCNGTNAPPVTSPDEPLFQNCIYPVGNAIYDFKKINPPNGDLTLFVNETGKTPYNIYLRMCSRITNQACLFDTTSTNSMICQIQAIANGNAYSLADYDQNNMIFAPIQGQQIIRFRMINGELCGTNPRTVTIDFMYDSNYGDNQNLITHFEELATCQYYMKVVTNSVLKVYNPNNPDASKTTSSDDINGGMVALIVIVIILGLILLVAAIAIWRFYSRPYAVQKDTKGIEMHGEPSQNTGYEHEESQTAV